MVVLLVGAATLAAIPMTTIIGQSIWPKSVDSPGPPLQSPRNNSPGWLIVDAKLVPGPYNVTIENRCIRVNGVSLTQEVAPTPAPVTPDAIRSNPSERDILRSSFWKQYATWVERDGLEEAQRRSLDFWSTHTPVAAAWYPYPSEPSLLAVRFQNEDQPNHFLLARPEPETTPKEREQRYRAYLDERQQALTNYLTNGCLVISYKGHFLYQPNGTEFVGRLRSLFQTEPDRLRRLDVIRRFVADSEMASDLADHFSDR